MRSNAIVCDVMNDCRGTIYSTHKSSSSRKPAFGPFGPSSKRSPRRRIRFFRSIERIVSKREEGDIVVRNEPLISVPAPVGTRECRQFHIFVLQAGPDTTHVALVRVLPESDREFLRLLNIESAGETRN
jgi:hypothetical protein